MRREQEYGYAVSRLVLLLAVFVFGAGVTAVHAAPLNGQTATQPTDKTIVVFGQSIHYWDVGSGPVVVLVHGLGSRKEDWLPVLGPLAQKYRLLVPDQIGFGTSDNDARGDGSRVLRYELAERGCATEDFHGQAGGA